MKLIIRRRAHHAGYVWQLFSRGTCVARGLAPNREAAEDDAQAVIERERERLRRAPARTPDGLPVVEDTLTVVFADTAAEG